MAYQLSFAQGELRIRFFGDVAHGDIVDSCVEAAADPRVDQLQRALIDFSDGDCGGCSSADISLIASVARQLSQGAAEASSVSMVMPRDASACSSIARLLSRGERSYALAAKHHSGPRDC